MEASLAKIIKGASDLVTSDSETKAGFIKAALEKNRKAQPYIDQAKQLKVYASRAKKPMDLMKISEIREMLLTASGLSDKAFKYFSEDNKDEAIKQLINEFLIPNGSSFVDELVYRYLLIKGDSLGGSMRNYVGSVAEMQLIRTILSVLDIKKIDFQVLYKQNKSKNLWSSATYDEVYDIVDTIKAISWNSSKGNRVLFFDTNIPLNEDKNVDINLYNASTSDYAAGEIVKRNDLAIMFGELKGGIDPAGADEHWKTANTALGRIRNNFSANKFKVKTSFIGAAIVKGMSTEIWDQLKNGTLDYAANLTVEEQLTNYCDWLINL